MKNSIISDEIIIEKVKEAISESLGIEKDKISLDASLVDDLGAESLDFLDISFRLEKDFHILLPKKNLLEKASELFGKDVLEKDGSLTDMGLALLKERMPELNGTKIKGSLAEREINSLFTVKTWVRLVRQMLDVKPKECKKCKSTSLIPEGRVTLKCSRCGEKTELTSGDIVLEEWLKQFYKTHCNTKENK